MRWNVVLLVCAITFVGAQSAQACSCIEPPPPREALAASDMVFYGQVIKTRRDANDINEGSLFATFRVRQIWKGELEPEIVIETAPNSAMCGVGFEKGDQYLVYASMQEGRLHTHLCTRTRQAVSTDEELVTLGKAEEPEAKPRGGCGGSTNVATLQGMFFIFLWIGYRRRRHG